MLWRPLLLIALAALIVVHPLIVHGCSCGHDFDFHLLNWMEAASQWSHGTLYPHWAYTPAYNAGEPRFLFYPPLSWMLGALLGLILTHLPGITEVAGWTAVPIVYTWIALTLSGVSLYRLAHEFASENAALLAAVLYLANPYMLFTAFERTAYSELLAAAWIPLLLLGILRKRITVPGIAIPLALLWLTNAPAAIMGSYTLALLAVVRLVGAVRLRRQTFALHIALNSAGGAALGLGLAGFYLVPAVYERRSVLVVLATVGGMGIDQNFLFGHMGTTPDAVAHDAVLHTASMIAVILLIATAAALALARAVRSKSIPSAVSATREPFPMFPLATLSAGIALLLTPLSAGIWAHVPVTSFVQFPWRLLAILAAALALTIAATLRRCALTFRATVVIATIFAASLTTPAYRAFHQPCYPEDTPPAQFALFHSNGGTDPTDEYTPSTADNDALKPNAPPYWLSDSAAAAAPFDSDPGGVPTHMTIASPKAEFLILNRRDYPAWHVFLNGRPVPMRIERDDGLIAFPIPAGASTIDLRYVRSADLLLGDVVTLIALMLLVWLLKTPRTGSNI